MFKLQQVSIKDVYETFEYYLPLKKFYEKQLYVYTKKNSTLQNQKKKK